MSKSYNAKNVLTMLRSGNVCALIWEGPVDGQTQRYMLHRNDRAGSFTYRASGSVERQTIYLTYDEIVELMRRLPQDDWTTGQVPDDRLPSRGFF